MRKIPVVSVGDRFGRLTVLERFGINDNIPTKQYKNGKITYFCKCICDCGKETVVRQNELRQGKTKSCGCMKIEKLIKRSKKYNTYIMNDDGTITIKDDLNNSFLIEDCDFEKIKPYYWFGYKKKQDGDIYAITNSNNKKIALHRFIMNAKKEQIVDHINRITTDCRRSNLRFASISENKHNSISKNYTYDKIFMFLICCLIIQ